MRRISLLGLGASISALSFMPRASAAFTRGINGLGRATGTRRGSSGRGSIALGNRHTGAPHEHKRERARRARQRSRLATS